MHLTWNQTYGQTYRGFESLAIRHINKKPASLSGFFFAYYFGHVTDKHFLKMWHSLYITLIYCSKLPLTLNTIFVHSLLIFIVAAKRLYLANRLKMCTFIRLHRLKVIYDLFLSNSSYFYAGLITENVAQVLRKQY